MSHQMQVFNQQPGVPTPPGAPVQYMSAPTPMPNVPPGLEYLAMIDTIVVKQKKSLLEIVTSWEVSNKYVLLNGAGQQAYFAFEESGCCTRQCCLNMRGFTIHIVDNFQKEVFVVRRPFKCFNNNLCANVDCCSAECTIETPAGEVLGVVRQRFGCCSNNYVVRNGDESQDVFRISGPNQCSFTYNCKCCADKVFEVCVIGPRPLKAQIFSVDGQQVGAIRKKWRGAVTELLSEADTFSVEFPIDLDVKVKATLIGATFLIDFLEFEQTQSSSGGVDSGADA